MKTFASFRLLLVLTVPALMSSCRKDTQIPEAVFVQIQLMSSPNAGGTVIGGGSYLPGTMLSVTATPSAKYYSFHRWSEGGVTVSTESTYVFEAETDRTLNAEFVDFQESLVGLYSGTRHHYSWMMGNPPTSHDTTYPYSFTVSNHPWSLDSIIVDGGTFPIDTSLSYYSMPYPGNIRSLDFRNDSCLIYFRSGGLGGFSIVQIKGLRQ